MLKLRLLDDNDVLLVEIWLNKDYLIGEESYIGKGLGKEMITLLVDRIFFTADISKDNKASEKALLSCGFALLVTGLSRYIKYNEAGR